MCAFCRHAERAARRSNKARYLPRRISPVVAHFQTFSDGELRSGVCTEAEIARGF